jgi:hypothetical protein
MKFKVGNEVKIISKDPKMQEYVGMTGLIEHVSEQDGNLVFIDENKVFWFDDEELELIKPRQRSQKSFKDIALEIGEFTDMKNDAYGSAFEITYEILEILLKKYKNNDGTYTIPENLLRYIPLTTRMVDKHVRIFNSPNGDKLDESPFRDLAGYSLIGVRMTENE